MLNTFLNLAATAGEIGTVTSALLYPSGYISIDITGEDGKLYNLTFTPLLEARKNGDS